jgi:hypothetical protein
MLDTAALPSLYPTSYRPKYRIAGVLVRIGFIEMNSTNPILKLVDSRWVVGATAKINNRLAFPEGVRCRGMTIDNE